jgi:putative oxidoreductase
MSNFGSLIFFLAGRALLATILILSGAGKVANAAATAEYMTANGLPALPALAVFVGAIELAAGLALAAGAMTRWAALSLAAFTLLTTLLFHAYWAMPPDQQLAQQLMFMDNLAIVGGLLFVSGRPASAARVRRPAASRAHFGRKHRRLPHP